LRISEGDALARTSAANGDEMGGEFPDGNVDLTEGNGLPGEPGFEIRRLLYSYCAFLGSVSTLPRRSSFSEALSGSG